VPTLREAGEAVLRCEVYVYDQYLSGEVYGWVTETDSCWGFSGSDVEANGLLEYRQRPSRRPTTCGATRSEAGRTAICGGQVFNRSRPTINHASFVGLERLRNETFPPLILRGQLNSKEIFTTVKQRVQRVRLRNQSSAISASLRGIFSLCRLA
jgi:hypothetical protein